MDDCVFCKIVREEIPADTVYGNNDFLAFLTIGPVSDGHLLIVPKKHVVWMQDAEDETIAEIFKLSKKLMLALKKAFKSDYVKVVIMGEEVPHFHVHLIPTRFTDEKIHFPHKKYKDGEAKEVAQKIIQAL